MQLSLKIKNRIIVNIFMFVLWNIIFISFIKPDYLGTMSLWDTFFNAVRVLFCLYAILTTLLRKKLSKDYFLVILYIIPPLIMTFINSGEIMSAIIAAAVIFGSYSLFEENSFEKQRYKLNILSFVMLVLIVINIITIFLYPDGLYKYQGSHDIIFYTDDVWFFGFKNNHAPFLILTCFTSVLNIYYGGKSKSNMLRVLFSHIVSIVTILKLSVGAGTIAFLIYFLCIFIFIHKKKIFVFDFKVASIIHLVLFIALTAFSVSIFFTSLFSLIGKDGTASRRIYIWAEVWVYIIKKPITGYGFMKSSQLLWLQSLAAGATTSHNTLLDLVFRGGIITIIIFTCLLFAISKRVGKIRTINISWYNYLTITFFSMFMTAQTEGFMTAIPIYIMLSLIANISVNISKCI